jgi:hypothetical protein
MTECRDADGNRPADVASLELAPLLDAEKLAALLLLTDTRATAEQTPAQWAKRLRDGGASLDAQDVRGVSPLIAAAVVGDVASLDAVLTAGASSPPALTMPKSGTSAAAWAQYASLEAMAALQARGARAGVADARAASRLLDGSRNYSADADALRVLAPLNAGALPLYRPVAESGTIAPSARGILARFALTPLAAVRASSAPADARPPQSALDFLVALSEPIACADVDNEFHGAAWLRVARAAAFFAQCRIAAGKSSLSPAVYVFVCVCVCVALSTAHVHTSPS